MAAQGLERRPPLRGPGLRPSGGAATGSPAQPPVPDVGRWPPNIVAGVEQAHAIGVLAKQALPYAEQFVAAGVAEGRWSDRWAQNNGLARKQARAMAEDAYRTRRSVEDVARSLGLTLKTTRLEQAA